MIFTLSLALAFLGYSLTNACGKKTLTSRVINGEDAQKHAWPWQISLRYNGGHICGGSLIKSDWVLTAAHCVAGSRKPSPYSVVVGGHQLSDTTSVQEEISIKNIISHKQYNDRQLTNDIALLQLERPVQLSPEVSPVCLPTGDAPVGQECYITGWGRTVTGGSLPNTLQQAPLPVASHQDCSTVNGALLPVDETTMVCAGGQGKGGCQGDSGGPFVCNEGGKWVLHGAVSWGHHECRTNYYTVFARVNSFVNWINTEIANAGGGGGGNGNGNGGNGNGNGNGNGGKPGKCFDVWADACEHLKDLCSDDMIKSYCKKSCSLCS